VRQAVRLSDGRTSVSAWAEVRFVVRAQKVAVTPYRPEASIGVIELETSTDD
jgi:hypothetical protein